MNINKNEYDILIDKIDFCIKQNKNYNESIDIIEKDL